MRAVALVWRWYRHQATYLQVFIAGVGVVAAIGLVASIVRPQSDTEVADTTPLYQTLAAENISIGGRNRYRVYVMMPADYTRDETLAVLVDAARKALRDHRDARAVVVFGQTTPSTSEPFDKGRAQVSSDGKGWTGDGLFLSGADKNRIHVALGPAEHMTEVTQVPR
jgi:hypothetical protein